MVTGYTKETGWVRGEEALDLFMSSYHAFAKIDVIAEKQGGSEASVADTLRIVSYFAMATAHYKVKSFRKALFV